MREVNKKAPVFRARFSAITKEEIEHAFDELSQVDDCLAQAGESRQDIDLVWGAVLTRFLTMAKFGGYGNVRSAGRVQTPTLSLIVEREREREAFVPEIYWTVKGQFDSAGEEFSAGHATDKFKSAEAAQAVLDAVAGAKTGRISAVEKKTRKVQPPTPFNTTELQAAAAAEGIAPARTMRIAESLYMDGLISYPRVDNTVYPHVARHARHPPDALGRRRVLAARQPHPERAAACDPRQEGDDRPSADPPHRRGRPRRR